MGGLCGQKWTKGLLETVTVSFVLILNYYIFSISLTFYNKFVVTRFRYPLIMTSIHLLFKFCLASGIRNILECRQGKPRTTLNWKEYMLRVAPVGITSILDIGLSNLSFEYITVSLYTMTKTSAIVFLLGFALLLRVEKFRWLQLVVVLCISLGLFLFTFESTQFNATGFIMCLVASIVSGLRWSLTQLIAQKDALGLTNPVDFMYHIQPWMICGLLPAAAVTEGLKFAVDTNFINFPNSLTFFENFGILLVGAFMAFGLEFGEFLLVMKTSSLTLSVSAMFKECAILLIAHWLHGDEVSLINLLGLFCCLAGVAMHVYLKATKAQESPEQTGSSAVAYSALPNLDSGSAHSQENEDETVT